MSRRCGICFGQGFLDDGFATTCDACEGSGIDIEMRDLMSEIEELRAENKDLWRQQESWRRYARRTRVFFDEVESLRKDAARFSYIEQDADSGMSKIYGDDWIAVIDAAISSPENNSQ